MFESVKELRQYDSMVRSIVKREIRGRYKGSVLGALWNFITPLAQILVYLMVFSVVFRPSVDNFAVYLIVGMVPWILFSESLNSGTGIIVNESDMVKKIYFPRSTLPIAVVLSKLVNFLISTIIMFVVIAILGYGVNWLALLFWPVAAILFLLFTMGLTLILSALNVYLRDTEYIVNVMLMIVIWLTPVMYTRTTVDFFLFEALLAINPLTYFVELFQQILYWKVVPDIGTLAMCVILALAFFVIGWIVFNKLERDFAEVL